MTKKEYLEQLYKRDIDDKKVDKIQKLYGAECPDIVKKIVSNNDNTIFFDDEDRILSMDEIVDAKQDLHVDFIKQGMIPLVDCGENNFIVYHYNDKYWSKFNIIDETVFKKKSSLEELLK